jgi:hypothetical protein
LVGLLGCDDVVPSSGEALGPSFAKVGPGGTTLDLRPNIRLLDDGTVRVRVEAGCPEALEVLEAFVTVSQTTAFGEVFIPADCSGRMQKDWLIVTAFEGAFGPGPAVVSGFLLAEDPATFETQQGQDTETIDLR